MSRLASFKGPSTPTSSPSLQKKSNQPGATPTSPSQNRLAESPHQRQVRIILQDIRTVTQNWDDIVLISGLKALRNLVDARTELENALSSLPSGTLPRHFVVEPKVSVMERSIVELDAVISKLKVQFKKLDFLVTRIENLMFETVKSKGNWKVIEEPLWTTWSLEKFGTTVPDILIPYHRSLNMHIDIVNLLRSHSTPFEISRAALSRWVAQPYLAEDGWEARWEDLCAVEIDRWK